MACTYIYNGKEYTAEEMQRLLEKGEFEGVVGATLPPVFTEEGRVDVNKTVEHYLDEAVSAKQGIRKNNAKGYYYVNQKASGSNSYTQGVLSIKKINRIFDLPVLGSPIKIQTPTGIKYKVPILKDNIVKIQGAFERDGEYEYDDLIVASSRMNRFGALRETFKKQKSELYKRISQEFQKKKEAKAANNKLGVKNIDAKISKLYQQIENIDLNLKALSKTKDLESLLGFAEEHLREVEEAFKQPTMDVGTIAYLQRIMRFWQKAGDFNLSDGEPHILFDDIELQSDRLKYGYTDLSGNWVNGFAHYKQRMDHYSSLLREYQEDVITGFVQKYTGTLLNTPDIYKAITDIGSIMGQVVSLAETKDPMLQSLAIAIKNQSTKARMESSKINEKVDQLVEKVRPKLSAINSRDIYSIFKQKDSSGKETGDMVMRYSVDYFDEKDKLLRVAEATNKPKHWETYFRWRRNNEIMFDVRKLFPRTKKSGIYRYNNEIFTATDVDAHKRDLLDALGQKGYDKLMERLEKKIEEFEFDYELAKDRIYSDPTTTAAEKDQLMDQWDKINSPYWAAAKVIDNKMVLDAKGNKLRIQGQHRTYAIPKKYDSIGAKTKWYDPNFEIIEKDNDLFEFYDFMVETLYQLNALLPHDIRKNIRLNTIPTIKKTLVEKLGSDHSGKLAAIGLWDSMKEILRSEDLSDTTTSDIDPVTGEDEKNIRFHLMSNHRAEVEKKLQTQAIEFQLNNKRPPNVLERKEMEKNILHEMAQNKSFDLGKILKLYAFTAYSFHHKAAIEDYVKLLEQQFQTRKEVHTNSSGAPLHNAAGELAVKDGLDNYKKMLDYTLRRFYGLREQDVELKSNKKLFTNEELAQKKKLESLITQNEEEYKKGSIIKAVYESNKGVLQAQLDALGGVLTGSGVANGAIRWMQLKSMGWNVLSGIANMGFGLVSNIIEAGDGRLFGEQEYKKAMAMVMRSVLRNFSFNSYKHPTAMKIRNLMDKMDVLKDASDEMYKATSKSLVGTNKLRFLSPYQTQKRSEYINQAPVMIAMMLKETIPDNNGKQRPLWEAFDDNGKWNTAEFGKEPIDLVLDFKVRIDQAIKKIHGNYDPESPLMVKKTSLGRLLAQFRTWMFEGFFNRFGKEYDDYSLGFKRKGRYRSGFGIFAYANGTGLDWSKQSMLMGRELIRRMLLGHVVSKAQQQGTFMGQQYKFDDVDYANLSANVNETLLLITATIVLASLKHATEGEDDDRSFLMNVMINELLRVQTDILFYSNPSAMETLIKRPIPAMSLFSDGTQLVDATWKLMLGEDEIKSGVYAGDSRIMREVAQFLPGTTQAHKIYSSGVQLFDK